MVCSRVVVDGDDTDDGGGGDGYDDGGDDNDDYGDDDGYCHANPGRFRAGLMPDMLSWKAFMPAVAANK